MSDPHYGTAQPTITSTFPPAGELGAEDLHPPGVLKGCDQFFRALWQQRWTDEEAQQIWQALRHVDWVHLDYGHGWRVWYPDGTVVDSTQCRWADLGHGMIGGVAYNHTTRWLFQTRDPFYLGEDNLPRDQREGPPGAGPLPESFRYGTWVTDAQMRQFRLQAVLALTLETR